jgi:hypothetical protein
MGKRMVRFGDLLIDPEEVVAVSISQTYRQEPGPLPQGSLADVMISFKASATTATCRVSVVAEPDDDHTRRVRALAYASQRLGFIVDESGE